LLLGSQTGRSPAPTLPWGQWASLRYTSFAGGWGSCGFQEHSVSCEWFCVPCLRYLVCNFHQLLQVLLHILCVSALSTPTFLRPSSCTFLYTHAYLHLWMHSDASILHLHSSTVLQLHFRGHFRVHFCTPTPTFICGRTGDISILHLHSSVDVQRFLQCYSYIFAAIFVYIYVHPHLHSSRPITCLVFKVAKSAWLHFTHQPEPSLFSTLHSTSTLSEHFRDSTILYHKHFRKLLWVLSNAICCG